MTKTEFIKKYRGNYPDVEGRNLWKTWTEIEIDMEKDLNLLIENEIEAKKKEDHELL